MDKKVTEQEKTYLDNTLKEIEKIKDKDSKKYKQNLNDIQYLKKFFAENFYDIKKEDDELAGLNIQIENLEQQNVNLEKEISRLQKQRKNPYFGRFDFQADSEQEPNKYYIGLGLIQNSQNENLVYDWRADVCSLYYDDKTGKTSYSCPDG